MVAHYKNLCDMIFELNISFDIKIPVETLEKTVFDIMDKTYLGRKNPERNSKQYQQPE